MTPHTQSAGPQVVECVPNFSEGADPERVKAIIAAMRVDGVHLLDWSMNEDHNRCIVTIAGEPNAVVDAAVRGAGKAAELIDLTVQQGQHPRIGAADVIPFVPVSGIRLEQCALLARQAGLEIWRRYGIPIYFYEAAAARPDRASVEDIRRDQFEGLRDIVRKDASRRPDIGGPGLHPTAGACAVGARKFLVTYNISFDSSDVALARAIAKEIRASGAGKSLKAIGALRHGRAQLTMNISDYERTPISEIFAKVSKLAAKHKTAMVGGEVVGLIPEAACERESEWMRHLIEFDPAARILERRLENPLVWPDKAPST
ncbi:glutamate formimidoyltransferase [Occallatibacter riparius]|uniref:glutamate formimidoyltransferase n=1 Tax=Occallatibacter riparius TaxID=1002689 RepID=A0A9J7BNN6_9BACT|nr:glutamate formimidoyltransferase [Occallatibacter riparius]UWZ82773.1 glutamate formimidoyltransferase [Occallatibacter riparius]